MTDRVNAPSKLLPSPARILAVMLLVVFIVEVGVMFVLPHILPRSMGETGRALIDALLLTCVSAPAIWWIIVGPLRRLAMSEQARSETVIANAGDGVMTLDDAGRIISFNRAASHLFAFRLDQMLAQTADTIIPALPLGDGTGLELTGRRSDESTFPIAVSISRLPPGTDAAFVVIVRDLTESRRAEQVRITTVREREALRAQQMATLAQLATGVAHEIRNPLTSIKMLIQVNRDVFHDNGLPTKDLELVEQEIRRMERSITALLDYGRPVQAAKKQVALADVVERTCRLITGRCQTDKVEIEISSGEEDVEVHADADQLQQLFLNLSLNALDAMPGGGRLRFAVSADDDNCQLSVTDTGPGISAEVLSHLFSPFVTTKSNGIGLGLGICRRIAEEHHGRLIGDNLPEGGARFTLTLPRNSSPCSSSNPSKDI